MELTHATLRALCKKDGLYLTPELNEKLFLSHKGVAVLENLEQYSSLRALYAESNGLRSMSGLTAQTQLRALFLQENLIDEIEGLDACPLLDTLNLCKNRVSRIPLGAVQHLSRLKSLLLGSNELSHIDDVAALGCLPSLEVLDLQSNRLKADDLQPLLQLLARLPRLAVLYLHGNPLASSSPHYRQRVLSALRGLTFLDERPVFPNERRGCDAWGAEWARTGGDAAAAGAEEERARAACAREAHTEEVARHESFRLMVQQAQEEAAAKRALAAGGCNGRAETAASTAAPEQIALSGGLEASGNGDDGADDDDDRCSTASETQLRNRGNGPHSTASSADPDGMPGLEPWERTAQAFGLLDPESDIDPKLIIN